MVKRRLTGLLLFHTLVKQRISFILFCYFIQRSELEGTDTYSSCGAMVRCEILASESERTGLWQTGNAV